MKKQPKIRNWKLEAETWKSLYEQEAEKSHRLHGETLTLQNLIATMTRTHTEVVNALTGFDR